ncbi:MAG TPA: dephospho-CoA kinase [Dehalococcoidia bacterium]|nr:dephospho-CoA kinase [Dehalococcoidia bacterium]
MKVIGLTGGIGSGKSTVSGFLKELGAAVIDADEVGHEALKPGAETWREAVVAFGKEILTPDGSIDRGKLGEIVFGDPEALARLNQIVHPRISDMVKAQIEEHRRRGEKVVVLEMPLLVEVPLSMKAGQPTLSDELDEVWVTVAPEAAVLKRLEAKNGMSQSEALARIRSQMPVSEKVKQADVVIDTDCRLDELEAKVKKLWQRL